MEVKGFEMEEAPRRVTMDKLDKVVVSSGTSSAVKLVRDALDKETPDISDRYGHTKSLANFTKTLKDIDDEIQRFSNSNSSSVMIIKGTAKTDTEIKGVEWSMEISDHTIKDTKIDKDMLMDGKATELIPTEMMELNFEMAWVDKNHTKKGGPL